MRAYKHPQWLAAAGGDRGGVYLQEFPLLELVVEELPQPDEQQPAFWLCLGRSDRHRALQTVVPSLRGRTRASTRGVTLHADPSSTYKDRPFPVFILQGDLLEPAGALEPRGPYTAHKFLHTKSSAAVQPPISFLCSQLFLPVVDVVAVFLDDYPDVRAVAAQFAWWLQQGALSSRPRTTYPHLLVVCEQVQVAGRFHRAVAACTDVPLRELFVDVETVVLSGRESLLPESCYRLFKEELWHRSKLVRAARTETRFLFSARHVEELIHHRLRQLQSSEARPFNFVSSTRDSRAVATDLYSHLSNFLDTYRTMQDVIATATSILATALMMDHYVPGMHDFAPGDVFQALYEAPARAAFVHLVKVMSGSRPRVSVVRLTTALKRRFVTYHRALPSSSAAALHRANVSRYGAHWPAAYSADTCLMCLQRAPDGPQLTCGHQFCTVCIRVFCRATLDRYTFTFPGDGCLLCAAPLGCGFTVRLTPAHASLRVLSIDGGGYKAVGPLQILWMLSRRAGVPFLARRAFDVVVGTSSGGAVVAGSFVKGWSEEECLERFQTLAHQAFQPPIKSGLVRLLLSYACGSVYPSEPINQALQEAFGSRASIYDDSWATRHGIRVAIPVSKTPGNACHLFNNYNGRAYQRDGAGYQLIPASTEPTPLWEMIRATTAAPTFFRPHYLEQCNMEAMDGATARYRCNCPVKIADREARRFGDSMAYVVSLGTGSSSAPMLPWRGRYLGLLTDVISAQVDCNDLYQDYVHDHPELDDQGRLFRFDVELDPSESRLDAVGHMPQIRDRFCQAYEDSPELDALLDAVIREMFVFELVGRPEGVIRQTVRARVFCRWNAGDDGYDDWRRCIRGRQIRLVIQDSIVKELSEDWGILAAQFTVEVDLKNPRVSVQVQLDHAAPRHIAQSPVYIPDLVVKQGLHTWFSTPESSKGKRGYEADDSGGQPLSKKRKVHPARPRRSIRIKAQRGMG